MASSRRMSAAILIGSFLAALGTWQHLRGAPAPSKSSPDEEPTVPVARVGIQLGPAPNELERYAADELARYTGRLFQVEVMRDAEHPDSADALLLVGTPETNPAVKHTLGAEGWPRVSDQGIVLKQAKPGGKPALVIGGGSPAATLWAVYELAERWGVRLPGHRVLCRGGQEPRRSRRHRGTGGIRLSPAQEQGPRAARLAPTVKGSFQQRKAKR